MTSVLQKTHRRGSRAALSLLEVLLAMMLSTVLLAGLWAALTIHVRMFDAGRTDVEQAQLARALLQQIAHDLRSSLVTTHDLPASEPAEPLLPNLLTEPAPTRPLALPQVGEGKAFEMVGGPHHLRLDVRDPAPPGLQPAPTGAMDSPEVDPGDLRTVEYYLFDEQAGMPLGEPDVEVQRGFARRIANWASLPIQPEDPASGGLASPTSGPSLLSLHSRDQFDSLEETDSLGADRIIIVPEVVRASFRYYDGQQWHEEWHSRARGGLPRAVEIVLSLETEAQRPRFRRAGTDEAEQDDRNGTASSVFEIDEELPTYRLVVHCMGAPPVSSDPLADPLFNAAPLAAPEGL